MKNPAIWICLGMLLTSIASTIGFQEDPQRWRYQFSLTATVIFSLLFLLGLAGQIIKNNRGR